MAQEPLSWREYFLLIGLTTPFLLIMGRLAWYAIEENRVFKDKVAELMITGSVSKRFDTEYRQFESTFTRPFWGMILLSIPTVLISYFALSMIQVRGSGWCVLGIAFFLWLTIRLYRRCDDYWLPWRRKGKVTHQS